MKRKIYTILDFFSCCFRVELGAIILRHFRREHFHVMSYTCPSQATACDSIIDRSVHLIGYIEEKLQRERISD